MKDSVLGIKQRGKKAVERADVIARWHRYGKDGGQNRLRACENWLKFHLKLVGKLSKQTASH